MGAFVSVILNFNAGWAAFVSLILGLHRDLVGLSREIGPTVIHLYCVGYLLSCDEEMMTELLLFHSAFT